MAGVVPRGLRQRELLRGAVEGVGAVADPVRPRHQHLAASGGRHPVLGEALHEVAPVVRQRAERGTALGDHRAVAAVGEQVLVAAGAGRHLPDATVDEVTMQRTERRSTWAQAGLLSLGFVALLWVLEIVDAANGHALDGYGVTPRSEDGLVGILFAPLLHGGWAPPGGQHAPGAGARLPRAARRRRARPGRDRGDLAGERGRGVAGLAPEHDHPRRLGARVRLAGVPDPARSLHQAQQRDRHRSGAPVLLRRAPARRAPGPAGRVLAGPPVRCDRRRTGRRVGLATAPPEATPTSGDVAPREQPGPDARPARSTYADEDQRTHPPVEVRTRPHRWPRWSGRTSRACPG